MLFHGLSYIKGCRRTCDVHHIIFEEKNCFYYFVNLNVVLHSRVNVRYDYRIKVETKLY